MNMGTQPYQAVSNASPIFIVGAPRTGTTLVARILGRHRDIFSPGESHYFEDIWTRRRGWGKLEDDADISAIVPRVLTLFGRFAFPGSQDRVNAVITDKALISRTRTLGGGYGALYLAFMGMLAESEGKTRFCDDTPKHLYYLHTIFDLFPNAQVIGTVRDPRDFLCSYKNYWKATPSGESARVKALYHPVITSLLWRSSSNLLLKHAHQCCQGRVLLVPYERLVEQPQEEVGRICDFLGIDYSDGLIQVQTHNSSFEKSSTGVFTTSVGRWRTCLGAEETWYAQTLTRDNMLALGYELETVNPSKKALFLSLMTTPLAFVDALRVNAHKRGPLLGYVFRRLPTLLRR